MSQPAGSAAAAGRGGNGPALKDEPRTEDEVKTIPRQETSGADVELVEDTDGRELFEATTRYSPEHRTQQRQEGFYIGGLLAADLTAIVGVGAGWLDWGTAEPFMMLPLGGLLGGLVYDAKWLYHSIAKGLWHEDRRMWRFLTPWISLSTAIGIGALMNVGFFRAVQGGPATSGSLGLGIGFLVGYFADRFLAKMGELTEVLFGRSERHYRSDLERYPPEQ